MDTNSERKRSSRHSNRYWSLMIVGEHGQVISMQKIKPLIIIAAVLLVISVLTTAVSLYLYFGQKQKAQVAGQELYNLERNLEALKEEKDILMAKLVISQQQNRKLLRQDRPVEKNDKPGVDTSPIKKNKAVQDGSQVVSSSNKANKTRQKQSEAVKLAVDIQGFQVTYDPMEQILKATFRVVNSSRPKVSVYGKAVVVFKATGTPPIKWLACPRVKLIDGSPNGRRGKSFRINNFKHMAFIAPRVPMPVPYDMASVYVFDRKGGLLMHQEFEFSLPKEVMPLSAPDTSREKTQERVKQPAKQKQIRKELQTTEEGKQDNSSRVKEKQEVHNTTNDSSAEGNQKLPDLGKGQKQTSDKAPDEGRPEGEADERVSDQKTAPSAPQDLKPGSAE